MWSEMYPADAHDAPLLPADVLQHLESRGPCGRKCAQPMLMLLQHLESRAGMWPEMYPADAHDAPFLPRQMRAITGQMVLQHLESRGGPCGRKCTQLMLMMLPSCLLKCTQSLGQMVLQHLESRGAMWPEMYPADAHDTPFLPRQMRASHLAGNVPS